MAYRNILFYYGSTFTKLDGGITQLINKVKMFENMGKYNLVIMNNSYDPESKSRFINITKFREVDIKTKFFNEIDVLLGRDNITKDNDQSLNHLPNLKYVKDVNSFDKMGAINKRKNAIDHIVTYDEISGRIKEIAYYEKINGKMLEIKKDAYDSYGYIYSSTYMNLNTTFIERKVFYNKDGKIKVEMFYKRVGEENKQYKIIVYNDNFMPENIFDDLEDFNIYLRNLIFSKYNVKETLVINDNISLYSELKKINGLRIVNQLHNIHLLSDNINSAFYDNIADISNDLRNDKNTFLVTLTEAQKKDIESRIGKQNNIKVIPNAISINEETNYNRPNNKLVVMARLDDIKRVDLAIKVFKLLHEKDEKLELEIYGVGVNRNKLLNLISELRLEKSVHMKGFCTNPNEVLSNSTLLINTSSFEAYPMLLIESINNGCPVVSFDIHYGIREIISDKQTGIIVENNNLEKMAEEIYLLLQNKKRYEEMIDSCYTKRHDFTFDKVIVKWEELLKNME
ncbi:glycosyltransferase [Oceanivirga miroungae]|uniref:Group 1 glycosyl transferase n=1 Tax=Oceanivirga miroungae TaxID=1130046 RepID=A0A6I8M9Q4_9FUSO|nr:glycosyltransferase [Oceanivirga miroungae]VWL84990.1 group 1 glycosyl transferase [Oceanivirga miroungae]